MLSLTVCFLVTVTVMIFFNGAEGDDVGRGSATTGNVCLNFYLILRLCVNLISKLLIAKALKSTLWRIFNRR